MKRIGRWMLAASLALSAIACGSREVDTGIDPEELDPQTREQMELMIRSREDANMMAPSTPPGDAPAETAPTP